MAVKKAKPVGTKAQFPSSITPMLCTLVGTVEQDDDYVYEVKWDGYRIMGHKNKKTTILRSRSGLNYNKNYPPVMDAVASIPHDVVLDGEVLVLDDQGKPDFDALQKYNGNDTIAYYIFDILWLDGYNLMDVPLETRKELLKSIIGDDEILKLSDTFPDGIALFEQIETIGLEGIVAKRKGSKYHQGERGQDWLKMKTEIRQEYVIGGWTESENSRYFRSLLFGYYKGNDFYYQGHSGGGFKESDMKAIYES